MNHKELLDLADFLSILESVLIFIISYIGAIIHEYLFAEGEIKLIKNVHLWITVIIDFIICYSFNPYIVEELNPRLVLLPPLIIGLLGNELAKKLISFESTKGLLEYVLGFFGITNHNNPTLIERILKLLGFNENNNENNPPSNNNERVKMSHELSKEYLRLQKEMVLIHLDLDNLLMEYYEDELENADKLITNYSKIKSNIEKFMHNMRLNKQIPIEDALKLADIMRKEIELDRLFAYLTQNSKEYIKNTTSK